MHEVLGKETRQLIADQKQLWLNEHIWPEIHAMMQNDAYFRLWLQARELGERPNGPIAQTMINGYATYQLAAIRRICDRSTSSISLPKLLNLIRKEQPHRKGIVDSLSSRLKTECEELSALASQYVAHHGNPARPDRREWSLTSNQIGKAQNAICTTAIVIERDLLAITQRTHIIPVPQFDLLAEVRSLVPEDKLTRLREFWDEHNKSVNGWVHVPKLFTGPRSAHPHRRAGVRSATQTPSPIKPAAQPARRKARPCANRRRERLPRSPEATT